jgi:hypothetical protein
MLGGGSQNNIASQDTNQNIENNSPASQNDLDDDIPF